MKIKRLRQGDVFYFPYLWKWQFDKGLRDAKDRTCCLAFNSVSRAGNVYRIIVPISDRPSDPAAGLEVPEHEKRAAGLDMARRAFIHVSEYNFDPEQGSLVMPPSPQIIGRFGRVFLERVTNALAGQIRTKQASGIDRREP